MAWSKPLPSLQRDQPITEKGERPHDQLVQLMDELRRRLDELEARVTAGGL